MDIQIQIAAAAADLAEVQALADLEGMDHFWRKMIQLKRAKLAALLAQA